MDPGSKSGPTDVMAVGAAFQNDGYELRKVLSELRNAQWLLTDYGRPLQRQFADQRSNNPEHAISYEIQDYLKLVDWTSRAFLKGQIAAAAQLFSLG